MNSTHSDRSEPRHRVGAPASSADFKGARLSTRLATAMVAVAVFTAAAAGYLINRQLEDALLPAELQEFGYSTARRAKDLEIHAAGARIEAFAFQRSPAVEGLVRAALGGGIDQVEGSTVGQLADRLARSFVARLDPNPAYREIALIGVDGHEIIRVERVGSFAEAQIVPKKDLLRHGDAAYFKETIRLAPGLVHVAPIDLDRERGAIETRRVPILRVGVPIFGVSDRPFGILVVAIDMRPAFARLAERWQSGESIFLVNDRGDFLLHPDPAREFGFTFGRSSRIQDEFPDLGAIVGSPERQPVRILRNATGERIAVSVVPLRLAHGPWVQVVATLPEAVILGPVNEVRQASLIAASAATVVALALGIWFARTLTRPLSRVTEAVAAFSNDGSAQIVAPTEASGEIGLLARTFARMATDMRVTTDALLAETEERRRSAETLQAMIDESPAAIIGLDPDRNVFLWNRAAERTFGYAVPEVIGERYPLVPPGGEAEFDGIFTRAASGERLRNVEVRRRHRSGKLLDIVFSGAPLYRADGTLRGVVFILEDVTEKRLIARQLHQSQKMETVGQLAGGMAHDFNNMLAVIIGNLDLLVESGALPADAKDLAKTALEAGLRGASLTRQLLAFSRRQSLQPKVVQINELVSGMTKMLARTLGEGIKVDLRLSGDLWSARVDPPLLESALANLAVNARDAMNGRGRLTVETRNGQIDADYVKLHPGVAIGDYVIMSVSDTGCGIPPENLERVFEPFFSTKDAGKGTGLGLSMVYGFVKQSGGHINIYSEVGVGTTVRIYLPRCQTKPDEGSSEVSVKLLRGNGETVLVVEDNAGVRHIAVRSLTDLGYRVLEAENATVALTIFRGDADISVLFTDIVMPGGMSGLELAERARADRPNLKVVFATGFSGGIGNDGEIPSFGKLLTKPYRQPELARVLHDLLEEKEPKP